VNSNRIYITFHTAQVHFCTNINDNFFWFIRPCTVYSKKAAAVTLTSLEICSGWLCETWTPSNLPTPTNYNQWYISKRIKLYPTLGNSSPLISPWWPTQQFHKTVSLHAPCEGFSSRGGEGWLQNNQKGTPSALMNTRFSCQTASMQWKTFIAFFYYYCASGNFVAR
jgi:hypothetical protein